MARPRLSLPAAPPPVHPGIPRRRVLTALLAAPLLAACSQSGPASQGKDILASPNALTTPTKDNPNDMQALAVEISDGKFSNNRYEVRVGAVRLIVTAKGGPYKLTIEPLVAPRDITANGATTVEFNVDKSGEYTMKLGDSAQATAVLNVREVGSK